MSAVDGDFTGHFGEEGPAECGPGLHDMEADLSSVDISFNVDGIHTGWLWASVNWALQWEVPKT
jgi:hypothetical protein